MKLAAAALALLALLSATAPATTPLAPAAFRDRYAAAMRAASHRATSVVDDKTFTVKSADGSDLTINVDNAYAQYLADPAQLEPILTRYVRLLMASDRAPAEPIEQLVVIVRPTDYVTASLRPGMSKEPPLASRPMAGDLAYFLAVDAPETIRTASRSDLKRWNVDEAAAWRRAVTNVKARVGALAPVRLGDENGALGFGADSGLAPSILADPALCGPSVLTGTPAMQVVLVYAKDMMLVAAANDRPAIAAMWAEAAAGRSMSATPLTCRGGRWTALAR